MKAGSSSHLGWTLGSFYAFYFATLGAVIPYMSLYFESIGFSPEQIGVLMSTLLITKIIAPNFWGYVIDRKSLSNPFFASKTLFFSLCLCSVLFLSLNFTEDFWLIALLMLGYSFFWNAVLPQIEVIVYNYLGKKRYRYGLIRVWGSIGFIIIVIALGWLIDNYGIQLLLPIITVIFVILVMHALLVGRAVPKFVATSTVGQFKHLFTPTITLVLFLGAVSQMTHAPFYTFFSIYLDSYGYSKTLIGWLWALGVIAEVFIFLLAHHLLVRFDIFKLLLTCFVITSLRWLLLSLFPESLGLLALGQSLHAISFGLYHSTSSQLINSQFKGVFQVRGQALYSSVTFGLGGSIGTLCSGFLWSHYGGAHVFMLCAVVMGIATTLGVIFTVFLRR